MNEVVETIEYEKKEFINAVFYWNKKCLHFDFDFITFQNFTPYMERVPDIPLSEKDNLQRTKKLQLFFEEHVTGVLKQIEITKEITGSNVMTICIIMNFLTKFAETEYWHLLNNLIENPKFQCSKKIRLIDTLCPKHSKPYFINLSVVGETTRENNSFIRVNAKWKQHTMSLLFDGYSLESFEKLLMDANRAFQPGFDKFEFLPKSTKLLDEFFEYYQPSFEVHSDLLSRVFCMLYCITKQSNSNDVSFSYRLPYFCTFCQKMNEENRKKCSGCKSQKVCYCSEDCQKKHWFEHKAVCEKFNKIRE